MWMLKEIIPPLLRNAETVSWKWLTVFCQEESVSPQWWCLPQNCAFKPASASDNSDWLWVLTEKAVPRSSNSTFSRTPYILYWPKPCPWTSFSTRLKTFMLKTLRNLLLNTSSPYAASSNPSSLGTAETWPQPVWNAAEAKVIFPAIVCAKWSLSAIPVSLRKAIIVSWCKRSLKKCVIWL